jgi:DNA-binding MarR family transcriptional regulator
MQTELIITLISAIRDKANRFILQQLKSLGFTDIAPAHGGVFVHLFRNAQLTMGEIAQLIDRDKSTVTTLVEKLVALGYLERERDAADNRVTKVRLTKRGKSLEADFAEISRNLLSKAYTGFSDKEKVVLVRLLTRVNNNF